MTSQRWKAFWEKQGSQFKGKNKNLGVQRSRSGVPSSLEEDAKLMSHIYSMINLKASDDVLELFCGNGLITIPLSKKCKSVLAVDFSENLIDEIHSLRLENVETVMENVMKLDYSSRRFDIVIAYAGIQYLSEQEVAQLMTKIIECIKPGGTLLIGDIPDVEKRWQFISTSKYEERYFDDLIIMGDPIGTWYEKSWILKLLNHVGFDDSQVMQQPDSQINSHYRFDVIASKNGAR